jgi:hypothetical protein
MSWQIHDVPTPSARHFGTTLVGLGLIVVHTSFDGFSGHQRYSALSQ